MSIININNFKLSFQNQHTVYENYITTHVSENEFNLSYNPSLRITGSDPYSELKSFTTGSDFSPYVSMVGFYNDDNELLMVSKFAQPVPISVETDMTFLIRYDT
jgi:DNA relaxase NicK